MNTGEQIALVGSVLAVLIALVGWLVFRLHQRLDDLNVRPNLEGVHECRIDEEWHGLFIGRKYCSTHDEHWDPPRRTCPGLEREQRAATALPLAVGLPIPLRCPDGIVREFIPLHIEHGTMTLTNGIAVDLIDVASYEFNLQFGRE